MDKYQIFISYKTGKENTERALALKEYLESINFDVFLDQTGMSGGHPWPIRIHREVCNSDVLLLLITDDVDASKWVQHEVDFARGAQITVVPVKVESLSNTRMEDILESLGLDKVQYIEWLAHTSAAKNQMIQTIDDAVENTRIRQTEWFTTINERWKEREKHSPAHQKAKTNPDSSIYKLVGLGNIDVAIHVASGDIIELEHIDVIVNSENTYMQMARFFETKTVSSNIRQAGSRRRGPRFFNDRIQEELSKEVEARKNGSGIPVDLTEVFVTSAGDKAGKLVDNGYKYVMHVAAIEATQDGLRPLQRTDFIEESVRNCLQQIEEMNNQQTQVKSIVFPLLGTGTGGLQIQEVMKAMLDSLKRHLMTYSGTAINKIYISAYTNGNVRDVEDFLDSDADLQKISS